jgi:hypothetical protein
LITGVVENEPFLSYPEWVSAYWKFQQPAPHQSVSSHMVKQLSHGSGLPFSQTKLNKLCGLGGNSSEGHSHLQSSTLLRNYFVFYSPVSFFCFIFLNLIFLCVLFSHCFFFCIIFSHRFFFVAS